MTTDALDHITGLDATRFERARQQAEEQIRLAVPMPDKARYTAGVYSKYPPAVTAGALLALAVVAIAMFWISAGKALVAADLTLGPMVGEYARLSPVWLDTALILFLLAGEVGAIIFSAGRALLSVSGRDRTWLSVAALASAAGALLANVSVTALHQESIASLPWFGWFMAIMPPSVVLAVGLFIEKLLLGALEARANAKAAYEAALAAWREAQEHPAEHDDFKRRWALAIFDQLLRISPANRQKIAALVDADPAWRVELVRREVARHEWANAGLSFGAFGANAKHDQTRILPMDHPVLPNGVSAGSIGANGANENFGKRPNGANDQTNGGKLEVACIWLDEHPEMANQPVSTVWAAMLADGLQVGRDTAYKALKRVTEAG